jgi:uncharacterized Tic20 family protein
MTDDAVAEEPAPPTHDERVLGVVAHVAGFFTSFFTPLVLLLVQKDPSGFAARHAREALNYQIALIFYATVGSAAATVAFFVLLGTDRRLAWVVFFGSLGLLCLFILVTETLFVVLGSVAAWKGRPYRYPLSFRLV